MAGGRPVRTAKLMRHVLITMGVGNIGIEE